MSEVQAPESKSLDPRWITLRVSRLNLGVALVGALLVFPVMFLISEVAAWIRLSLLGGFVLALAWDLRLILLKGRESIGAFYLFDLDPASRSGAKDFPSTGRIGGADSPRLGIRIRFANPGKDHNTAEREGVVLHGAFVSPWFTALRFQIAGDAAWRRWWPRVIPLWADSLDDAEFRKVRVALKWK